MSYKVLVMSPIYKSGVSTVAALLTQGLTYSGRTAMMTYTNPIGRIPSYLGIQDTHDITRSIMQVIKLLEHGALDDSDILDYTSCFAKNAYIMSLVDETLSEDDRINIVRHMFAHVPTDIAICDNHNHAASEVSKTLYTLADVILFVVDQSWYTMDYLKRVLTIKEVQQARSVCLVINHYSEVVNDVRSWARHLGFPYHRVCKIHESPWIRKCALTGTLQTILPLAMDYDPRVAILRNDILELNQLINTDLLARNKKGSV